jgi:hypothetical protein
MPTATLSQPAVVHEARWNLALLRQMDWKLLHELVMVILQGAGFEVEVAWVRPDCSAVLSVTNPRQGRRLEALVQCPPWASQDVESPVRLKELYQSVQAEGALRGIYITAGRFSEEARMFARPRPLELIDGDGMLSTLLMMPPEEQSWHMQRMTAGAFAVPTCPACPGKMEVREDSNFGDGDQLKDMSYRDRRMEASKILCRTLTIKRGADVQFLSSVSAQDMIVNGTVQGNVTVQGRLTVGRGGVLRGLVAARTITMEEGGAIEAEARVLNANEIQPVRAVPSKQVWRCLDWPKCPGELPVR